MTIPQLYRETTVKALNKAKSIAEAAQLMGVTERTVYNWMNEFNIMKLANGRYI